MQSHYGTWMPIKEGATIPLAWALLSHLWLNSECPLIAVNSGLLSVLSVPLLSILIFRETSQVKLGMVLI